MAKNRKYYIIVDRNPAGGSKWAVQFGDYDKECVEAELQDMTYSEQFQRPRGQRYEFKMLCVMGDDTASIDARVAELNSKLEA